MIIKDPLYNYIRLNDIEEEVIELPQFQRLRYIKQIAVGYLVYPGANHTRFEHSLGTMHLAKKYLDLNDVSYDEELVLAAMLHDVGHGPFSHASEFLFREIGLSHEDFSFKIVREVLPPILEKYGLSAKKVANYIVGKGKGLLITGTIGVDRMDYLMRDSYYSGAVHGKIDYEYMLENLRITRKGLALNLKGIEAAESLVLSRYMMFTTLYQHKTVEIATEMLKIGLLQAYERGEISPEDLINMNDFDLMVYLRDIPIISDLLNRRLYKPAFVRRHYQLPEDFVNALDNLSLVDDIHKEIVDRLKLDDSEVIIKNLPSSYKPIRVIVNDGSESVDLSEISPFVDSLRKSSEMKRLFFVAVPAKYRNRVRKIVESFI